MCGTQATANMWRSEGKYVEYLSPLLPPLSGSQVLKLGHQADVTKGSTH